MQRREFLAASLATSAAAFMGEANAQKSTAHAREFYLIRRYQLQGGSQTKLTESYFKGALVPALNRMGMNPVGAFALKFGPDTPRYYLLIPSGSVEALATLDLHLAQDSEFMESARSFWNAPAAAPAFQRIESSLLAAFEGWPKITPPEASGEKSGRIYQLRTYESASDQDHVRKVEMFHSGEFDVFKKAGAQPVFFGDTLVGQRMPNLTYMLSFASMEELDKSWDAFGADPAWKKLSANPRFSFEQIVSNISNQILTPLPASQI